VKEDLLVSWIREIHEQLQKDLSQPSMEPPQKRIKKEMVIKTEELALVPVKEEPDSKVEPPLPPRDAEPYMSKQELMVVHNLKMLQKGEAGKTHPMKCFHCNVVFQARNRAQVYQHCMGQEHRRRKGAATDKAPNPVKEEPDEGDKLLPGMKMGRCLGLSLGGFFGQKTRLGSDLKEVWERYAVFAEMQGSTPAGGTTHTITHHMTPEKNWTIRCAQCVGQHADVLVSTSPSGESVCSKCLELASNQKYLSRVCGLILEMDVATLLFKRMFAQETAEEYIEELKASACYQRRCKTQYDKFFAMGASDLWSKIRSSWHGRSGHKLSEPMQIFFTGTVKPCLEVEAGHSYKHTQMEQLLHYMRSDPTTSASDLSIIRAVVTQQVHRHPAVHGIMASCMNKLDNLEKGKATFRNPRRAWDEFI